MKRQRKAPRPSANGRAAGQKAEELARSFCSDGSYALSDVTLPELKPPRLRWLSRGRLALGAVTVLDGPKGSGKSTLAAWAAAAATGVLRLPDQEARLRDHVLWFAGEEDMDTLKRKLLAAGAYGLRMHFPGRRADGSVKELLVLPDMEAALEQAVIRWGAKLVVLDPLASFVGGADMNQEAVARAVMGPLTRIAQQYGCCILCIRHPRKAPAGSAVDRGLGSVAISAASRVVMTTGVEPDTGQRLLGVAACNGGKKGATLAFDLVDKDGAPVVKVVGEVDTDPEQFEPAGLDEVEVEDRLNAIQLLQQRVHKLEVPVNDILREGKENGIDSGPLKRARKKLGMTSRRVGGLGAKGHWVWGPAPERRKPGGRK